jgi:hypothetical protein
MQFDGLHREIVAGRAGSIAQARLFGGSGLCVCDAVEGAVSIFARIHRIVIRCGSLLRRADCGFEVAALQ